MNTAETAARPVNEKAMRRWIDEGYEGAASCVTWTVQECRDFVEQYHAQGLEAFRQAPYQGWSAYTQAAPEARATVTAVFNAVANVASPAVGLEVQNAGVLACSFTWHDGAQYRVDITRHGFLARLYRLELVGGWVHDEALGAMIPDSTWRTVRVFTRDRAGKVLGPALAGFPAFAAWSKAAEQ